MKRFRHGNGHDAIEEPFGMNRDDLGPWVKHEDAARIQAAGQKLAEAFEAMLEPEWEDGFCWVCGRKETEGHAEGCGTILNRSLLREWREANGESE